MSVNCHRLGKIHRHVNPVFLVTKVKFCHLLKFQGTKLQQMTLLIFTKTEN